MTLRSEQYTKILTDIKEHPDFSRYSDLALQELDELEKLNLLSTTIVFRRKIDKGTHTIGDKNPFNTAVAYLYGLTSCPPGGDFFTQERRTYGRDGMPDIDMDIDHSRRHEILDYIRNKYGDECVGNIGTLQTLKIKSSIRRVIKVLDPEHSVVFDREGKKTKDDQSANFALQNDIMNALPDVMKRRDGTTVSTVQEAYATYPEFKKHMDRYHEVFRVAKRMQGSQSAFGMHAGGIVISPMPLSQIAPLHVTQRTGGDKKTKVRTVATQFTMNEVESLGLIKFDILGLSTKTAIHMAAELVKCNHNVDIDLSHLPLDDEATLKLIGSCKTGGIFQLESTGMKQTLEQIGIDSFYDLMIAIAMYRPGPMDYVPELAARKRGDKAIKYAHPILEEVTNKTQGIMVFQEQIMMVFMKMANSTATDGYTFMKGCAKKIEALINKYEEQFMEGARQNKIDKKIAQAVWADLKLFSNYGFNSAHAAAYGYEAYKTAYLKAHYPLEFMAARLSVEVKRKNLDEVAVLEEDARYNLGMKILPPDLNKSKMEYLITGENELLRPILVHGVGEKAAQEIIKHQPFKGSDLLYSFASKVGGAVNTKAVEALYDAGLFGNIKKSTLMNGFEQIKKDRKSAKGQQLDDIFE